MNSLARLAVIAGACLGLTAPLPSTAQQAPRAFQIAPAFYFGAGGGITYADFNKSDFNVAALANQAGVAGGGWSQGTDLGHLSASWKVFLGYRFNPYLAIEAAYAGLGSFDETIQLFQGGAYVGNANMKYGAYSINIAAVPRLPFPNGLFLQGKVGAAFVTAENTYNSTVTVPGLFLSPNSKKTTTNLLLGAGVGIDFPNGLSLLTEWEYYGEVGNATSISPVNGYTGTGRADLNVFTFSGMIRF
jgi:hypothetical protein